jgi:RND family efflux transporter MFP subunit
MKNIYWIILVVFVLLMGWRIFQSIRDKNSTAGTNPGRAGGAVTVELEPVRSLDMRDIGRFGGSLKARTSYTLAPRIAGRLEKLLVNLGDRVSNGQLVAVMDDEVFQQDLQQSRANLAVAQAQVEQLRLAMKAAEGVWLTTKRLFEQNYESQGTMDRADAEYAAAKARYDIAMAEVQKAQSAVTKSEIQLSYTQIRAAWNGGGKTRLVGERFAEEGSMLSVNMPVMTLVDNSLVTAEIDIIEKDYVKIKAGQEVEIRTDAYPDKVFPGKLVRLAPVLSEVSRQAKAEIDIPNPEGLLKPGMFVRVQIIYTEHKKVQAVPVAALVQRENKTGVFVADTEELTVHFVPVKTAIQEGEFAEITEPLIAGPVVVLGRDQLQDGGKIRISNRNGNSNSGEGKSGAKQ